MTTPALIDATTYSRRLVALCLRSGVIPFPTRAADRAILEKSVTRAFDPDAQYSEKGVDTVLKQWIREIGRQVRVDHVTLRRALVDDGYLERRPDGTRYRVSASGPFAFQFSPDVDQIDDRAVIAQEAAAIQARRRAHVSGSKS
jgi:hypothetical protein